MDEILGGGTGEYIVVRAEEDGVSIFGLTRGRDTRFHHTAKLDKGEIYIAEFTEIDVYKRQVLKQNLRADRWRLKQANLQNWQAGQLWSVTARPAFCLPQLCRQSRERELTFSL